MNKMMIVMVLMVASFAVSASEDVGRAPSIKFFEMNSMKAIENEYSGKDFILVLWSLDCPPCFKELKLLGQWRQSNPDLKMVLVSTDSSDQLAGVRDFLVENEHSHGDNWLFGTASAMGLRYSIDPQWYGELPRSYFYQANRQRQAVSGMLTEKHLKQWELQLQVSI